ncbi:MAG: DUF4430 domain-containing protein [Kurthia sp.]|nr:DUF4430 domain-containing protein [Candidatus Kurthia equi]
MKTINKNKVVLLLLIVILIGSLTWNFSNIEKAIPENPIKTIDTVPNKLLFTSSEAKNELESKNGASKKENNEVAVTPEKWNEEKREDAVSPVEEKTPTNDNKVKNFKEESNEKSNSDSDKSNDNSESNDISNNKAYEKVEKEEKQLTEEVNKEEEEKIEKEKDSKLPNKEEQVVVDGDEDQIEIIEGNQDGNPYFTTTISNEETVSNAYYEFAIIHKNKEINVLSENILVNNQEITNFKGGITLEEGSNSIDISVMYDDENKTKVHRTYIIYFAKNDLIITSSLKDGAKATVQSLEFEAAAYYNDTAVAIEAQINGTKLVEAANGLYKVHLSEGVNKIVLTASHNDINKKQEIQVFYEKKISKISFETDLKNQQTTNAEITFYAAASVEENDIELTATLNGEKLREKNHYFSDLLKEGKNTITLSATTADDTHEETYVIYYQEEVVNNSPEVVPDDKAGPNIKTDLVNNAQVSGTKKNFNVWATTAAGKRIQASGVTVHNNNKAVSVIWDDSEKTSYRLNLDQGKNTVVIKAWDSEGRISTKSFTIYAKNIEKNDSIGTATVSIDASVVGLGAIVPPTKIELYEGVNGAYTVDQFLRKNGFTYENTGTLDSNFYLASISKPGMAKNLKIPEDMIKKINESTVTFEPTNFSPNSLGEFDLTSGSGWLYYVNGDVPNYGFSDAVFLDGDVIVYKYTLLYGAEFR